MSQRRAKRERKQGNLKHTISNSDVIRVSLTRPSSNARIILKNVPIIPNLPDSQGVNTFHIRFILAIPGNNNFHKDLDIAKIINSGESLISFGRDTLKLDSTFNGKTIPLYLVPNSVGVLSRIETALEADSIESAEKISYNLIMPALSYLSYDYNVALDISGYEIEDTRTQTKKWKFGIIGKTKAESLDISSFVGLEYARLFSAYREAMNSTNPFYQILSFYRVIEGLRPVRSRRNAEAKANGLKPSTPRELIPLAISEINNVDEWDLELFAPYLGKKFSEVIDEFRGVLRNAIAHLDPTKDEMNPDKFEDIQKCEKAIPVIKYIVRQMLSNEKINKAISVVNITEDGSE